jgi:hypothetical protein
VLDVTLHDEAGTPLLGDGPTLAEHKNSAMKFLPKIVMELLE